MPENKDIDTKFENSPIFLAILEIRYSHPNLQNIESFSEFKKDLVKIFPTSQYNTPQYWTKGVGELS